MAWGGDSVPAQAGRRFLARKPTQSYAAPRLKFQRRVAGLAAVSSIGTSCRGRFGAGVLAPRPVKRVCRRDVWLAEKRQLRTKPRGVGLKPNVAAVDVGCDACVGSHIRGRGGQSIERLEYT